MKKLTILLAILCLLAGCAAKDPTTAPSTQPSATQSGKPTESTAPTTAPPEPTQEATAPTESAPTEPTPTDPEPITFLLYHPDETLSDYITVEITMDQLDPEAILAFLQEYQVLKDDVALNYAQMDGTQLNLDLNQAFLMHIFSCGTLGEAMLMGSLVNTFFSVYDCESIMVTVDGEIIHSGHVDYETPFTRTT